MPLEAADLVLTSFSESLNGVRFNWAHPLPPGVRRVVPEGGIIFDEAGCQDHIWYVDSGLVKLMILSSDGKEQSMLFVGPRRTFGEAAAFDDYPYRVIAVAHRQSDVRCVSVHDVIEAMKDNYEVGLVIIKSLCTKIRDLASQIEGITLMDPRSRVQYALVRLSGTCGEDVGAETIGLPLSHRDIAAFTNLSRVTVTRVMHDLKREGIIRGRRAYVLIKRSKLIKMASSLGT